MLADPDDLPQDRRNIIDPFKYWSTEAIRSSLDHNRHAFEVVGENIAHDMNIGTMIRNANAFLAARVWIAGRRSWDRRGSVGCHHYEHMEYVPDSRDVIEDAKKRGMKIVAVDDIPTAQPVHEYEWDPQSVMIFGAESIGVSQWSLDAADDVVYIPQMGSVRSLNVGVASGILMWSYAQQMIKAGVTPARIDYSVPTSEW